ncbi:MAG: pyruvate kinase [Comamonadaceae bacterium]|uniref:pyruvate kinase n=1 Tax=Candidatus Skiveiella danica TaxID=3386177 RepID=UPI003908F80A|nr:pyruvate kinase [Comamonadaceae bacterium]
MSKASHKHRNKHHQERPPADAWDEAECKGVIEKLWALRAAMQASEKRLAPLLGGADATYQASARNLAHYLALRHDDQRTLQEWLTHAGVSSLGRSESHAMANLDKVLGILHRLTGQAWATHDGDEPIGTRSSRKLLERHTADLLGPSPAERSVRIMVTLPSEAASDFGLVRQLVASGMDIARINCAHDGPDEWKAMASRVRRAARAVGRPVRILMDLGGPKLRTGVLAQGAALLKLRPQRDDFGRLVAAAHVGLRPAGATMPVAGASVHAGVDADWLAQLEVGDRIDFKDARGARRCLMVLHTDETGALAACEQTAYLVPDTTLKHDHKGKKPRRTTLTELPRGEGLLHLQRGSVLRLTRAGAEPAAVPDRVRGSNLTTIASVACTLPEVFAQVCVGERIWFDDGRIGGVIRRVEPDGVEVEITHARDSGEKLAGDKGINLPDSQLSLPALTDKDIADLAVATKVADMVGLSFVQQADDVEALRSRLRELGKPNLGIVLKIETRRAFENLPELLFAAMAGPAAGIMIARGDLAVECGYERLAEVQEEILWAAEAAHMPVIWATQVLETLAKTGLPSRAEITDAAMGERAECVMLNKGPHITEAMRTLHDILRRMQAHQSKKRPLLRALRAWDPSEGEPPTAG